MRWCEKCYAMAADEEVLCPSCGGPLSPLDQSTISIASDSRGEDEEDEEHDSSPPKAERPDGSNAKVVGISLLVLGVLLSLGAEMMSVTEYSWRTDIDPGKVAIKAKLALAGGGFFQIGLIVWLAGYIVHAISFLPGKDVDAQD